MWARFCLPLGMAQHCHHGGAWGPYRTVLPCSWQTAQQLLQPICSPSAAHSVTCDVTGQSALHTLTSSLAEPHAQSVPHLTGPP